MPYGPPPQASRQRPRDEKRRARGTWQATEGIGWQHGPPPSCPAKLTAAAREAWATWMQAWFAAHWTPDDLPGLRQLVRLYNEVEKGQFHRAAELRIQMDTYGITPKGQQDRRWKAPERKPEAVAAPEHYGHLRAMD